MTAKCRRLVGLATLIGLTVPGVARDFTFAVLPENWKWTAGASADGDTVWGTAWFPDATTGNDVGRASQWTPEKGVESIAAPEGYTYMRFDVVSDAGTAWIVAARKTYLDDEAFFYWTEATGYVRMDIQDNLITTNFEISDDGKTILHTTKPGLPSSNGRYYYSIYKLNEAGGWDVFAPNSVAHSVNHDGSNIIFSADFGEHTRYEWKKGMYREVPEWVWRSVTRDITAIDLGDHLPHWVFAGEEEPRPFSGFRGRIATNQGSHGIINMSASSARAAIVIGNALTHTGAQVPVIWENGKILNLLNEVEDHEGLDYISNFHVHNTSLDGSTIWGSLWQDGAYRPWVIYDYTFPVLMPDLEAAVLNETTLRLSWHAQPSVRHVLQGRNIDGTWTDLETIDHSATEASLYQRDVSLNSYGYYRIVASRL